MSKICYVHPTQSSAPGLRYRQKLFDSLKKSEAVGQDVQIDIKKIEKATVTLNAYTETLYFELLQRPYTIEAVIQAEREGYDAAIIGCYMDPGLEEAREVANIPVVGLAEASFSIAHMLTGKRRKIAIISIGEKVNIRIVENIDRWGFDSQLISVRPVRLVSPETYDKVMTSSQPPASDIQKLKDESIKVARGCIQDGAEVVIPGCAGLGPFLATEGILEIDGAVILDPLTCAIKMAEDLIDIRKSGVNVSRRSTYRQLPKEDWVKERKNFGFLKG